jgi:hypothetical protein
VVDADDHDRLDHDRFDHDRVLARERDEFGGVLDGHGRSVQVGYGVHVRRRAIRSGDVRSGLVAEVEGHGEREVVRQRAGRTALHAALGERPTTGTVEGHLHVALGRRSEPEVVEALHRSTA